MSNEYYSNYANKNYSNYGSKNYSSYTKKPNYYNAQTNKYNPQQYKVQDNNAQAKEYFPDDPLLDDVPTTTNLIKGNASYEVDSSKIFQYNKGYALAMENATKIYYICKNLQEKKDTLLSAILVQVCRSSNSVMANLAESNNSKTQKMLLQKLYVAYGELNETLGHLEFLYRTNHISKEEHKEIYNKYIHIIRILRKSIHTIKEKESEN